MTLFACLEGKGGDLKKKEGVCGKNRGHWKEGFGDIKSKEELKNCIGGGF